MRTNRIDKLCVSPEQPLHYLVVLFRISCCFSVEYQWNQANEAFSSLFYFGRANNYQCIIRRIEVAYAIQIPVCVFPERKFTLQFSTCGTKFCTVP